MGPSPGLSRTGHKTDSSPPSGTEGKLVWSCTSTSPHIGMGRCLIKHTGRPRHLKVTFAAMLLLSSWPIVSFTTMEVLLRHTTSAFHTAVRTSPHICMERCLIKHTGRPRHLKATFSAMLLLSSWPIVSFTTMEVLLRHTTSAFRTAVRTT